MLPRHSSTLSPRPRVASEASFPFRRHPSQWLRLQTSARPSSTALRQRQTGHIQTAPNESVLFVDNIFPLKLLPFVLRKPFQAQSSDKEIAELLKRFNTSTFGPMDPIRLVKKAIPDSIPITVTQIIPRFKDGGAFVKFTHPSVASPSDIEASLTKSLDSAPIKPWFNPFRGIRAQLVQGVPWLEDLLRFPKPRLRVEFIPADADGTAIELSQEHIYTLFRRYGKIAEITSQSSDSKILPRFAHLDFTQTRDAIMARNCLHGIVIDTAHGGGKSGTVLRLGYEERVKSNWFWEWIKGHPRVVIPAVAAVLAAITVSVFDPIRTFFVKIHVQQTLNLSRYPLYRWFKSQTSELLPAALAKKTQDKKSLGTIWEHRRDVIDKIQSWLMETEEDVIVIQGPRGSGKKELLMDQALSGREHILVLDIRPICEAQGEGATIRRLAQSVGYRPVFSWINSISSLIDLALQSTTGVKSSFSETLDSQVGKILHTTTSALKGVALSSRDDDDVDDNLSDEAWLEAHPEKRPVVVVENFLHSTTSVAGNDREESTNVLNDKVAEWATNLVHNNVAHVLVLVEDGSTARKSLTKAMPDRGFKTVTMGDLSPDVAKKYILSHLEDPAADKKTTERDAPPPQQTEKGGIGSWFGDFGRPKAPEPLNEAGHNEAVERREKLALELDLCIPVLGGRLTDLGVLARRLRGEQSPQTAVDDIIDQSSSDLLRSFVQPKKTDDRRWTPEQAWYLIESLAATQELRYNEVVLDCRFAQGVAGVGPEEALDALVAAELVSLSSIPVRTDVKPSVVSKEVVSTPKRRHTPGRPVSIKPGRPVYQAAFKALVADKVVSARMEMRILRGQVSSANKAIDAAEKELVTLSTIGGKSTAKGQRSQYLLQKIEKAQAGIEKKEQAMAELVKVLMEED